MKKFLLFAFLTLAFLSCEPEEFADVEEITSKQQPLLFQNGTSHGNSDIFGKVTVGYQGWFTFQGDGSGAVVNKWSHWSRFNNMTGSVVPDGNNTVIDLWPDVSEYADTDTKTTLFNNLGNGRPANVFSSNRDGVIQTHIKWMRQYGINNIAIQRFATDIFDLPPDIPANSTVTGYSDQRHWRNTVQGKIADAVQSNNDDNNEELKYFIMYDLNGAFRRIRRNTSFHNNTNEQKFVPQKFADKIYEDWNATSNHTNVNIYSGQEQKPVVAFFNIGAKNFYNSALTNNELLNTANSGNFLGDADFNLVINTWEKIIKTFKDNGVYVITSPPRNWEKHPHGNTNSQSATNRITRAQKAIMLSDAIMPWAPTGDEISANVLTVFKNRLNIHKNKIDSLVMAFPSEFPLAPKLIPIVYPGYSHRNAKNDISQFDVVPRRGGNFLKDQFKAIKQSMIPNKETVYVAMFDEYDEGTAIMKAAETSEDVPVNANMISLEEDGYFLSNDYYLRLVNRGSKFLDGTITANQLDVTAKDNYFSQCENTNNWISNGIDLRNRTGYEKQRVAAISATAQSGNQNFSMFLIRNSAMPKILLNTTSKTAHLNFWLHINNKSHLGNNIFVEISTSNSFDQEEYQWNINTSNLVNGWNRLELPFFVNNPNFNKAVKVGALPNINTGFKRFRIIAQKVNSSNSSLRLTLDAIQVIP